MEIRHTLKSKLYREQVILYSSHLTNMKYFVQYGNDRTLLLIDEFGSGTEPLMGGALAEALFERFNRKEMFGIITTHYQNLKQYAAAL